MKVPPGVQDMFCHSVPDVVISITQVAVNVYSVFLYTLKTRHVLCKWELSLLCYLVAFKIYYVQLVSHYSKGEGLQCCVVP